MRNPRRPSREGWVCEYLLQSITFVPPIFPSEGWGIFFGATKFWSDKIMEFE